MSTTNDYLKRIDLNPAAPLGPVMNPLSPLALFMFGFEAAAQEITNLGTTSVFVSFDFAYDQGILVVPMPQWPTVHAVLQPGQSVRRESHARRSVIVWLDPTMPPPAGTAAPVQVSAWL